MLSEWGWLSMDHCYWSTDLRTVLSYLLVNFQDSQSFCCAFTLMSMGRVSVGQSSLRRALPPWFIVQHPVILTSGRGNLKIEIHMMTTARYEGKTVNSWMCFHVFVFGTHLFHFPILIWRSLGVTSPIVFLMREWELILGGSVSGTTWSLEKVKLTHTCEWLFALLCLAYFTILLMNHSWIVATVSLAGGGKHSKATTPTQNGRTVPQKHFYEWKRN